MMILFPGTFLQQAGNLVGSGILHCPPRQSSWHSAMVLAFKNLCTELSISSSSSQPFTKKATKKKPDGFDRHSRSSRSTIINIIFQVNLRNLIGQKPLVMNHNRTIKLMRSEFELDERFVNLLPWLYRFAFLAFTFRQSSFCCMLTGTNPNRKTLARIWMKFDKIGRAGLNYSVP